MSDFRNKTVLVSGAANGIGREIVKQIDHLQVKKIIMIDIDEIGLRDLSVELKTSNAYFQIDLSEDVLNNADFAKLIEQDDIDILIANAGLGGVNPGDNFSEEINRKIMFVNYFGTTGLVSLVLPKMLEKKSGHIVGVASLAGLRGMPQAASYSASKAAQITFLESLRLDIKHHGIKVLTVLPGFIATKMTEHDEFRMPFMLSPEATAKKIIKSIQKNCRTVYFPFPMNVLSIFNRFLPAFIYDRIILLINPPEKKRPKIF